MDLTDTGDCIASRHAGHLLHASDRRQTAEYIT